MNRILEKLEGPEVTLYLDDIITATEVSSAIREVERTLEALWKGNFKAVNKWREKRRRQGKRDIKPRQQSQVFDKLKKVLSNARDLR
ncbi:hypothetical protein OSTOST_05399 [Ostertagia ostertagi]